MMKVCLLMLFSFVECTFLCSQEKVQQNESGNTFKIMTFNVRNGRGMDEKVDYDRTATLIRKNNPDIVGIQELDSAAKRSNGVYVLEEIARRIGYQFSYASAIDFDGGKYGIGMLFKTIPLSTYKISLPGREEPRVLQVAEFEKFIVFNTHFSLTPEDREASVLLINAELKKYKKPVILLGDLNSKPGELSIKSLQNGKWNLISGTNPTFPAPAPLNCIDYIFLANKKASNPKSTVVPDPITSDHRAVIVELKKF